MKFLPLKAVRWLTALLTLALAASPGFAQISPKRILIIRHAEKAVVAEASVHLSDVGETRAKRLHELFEKSADRPEPFAKPDFVFATNNTKMSHRPVETVTPLAKHLMLPINNRFHNTADATRKGIADLCKEILEEEKYRGKTILVCWHHGTMTELAVGLKATKVPNRWRADRFDRVWELTYDATGVAALVDRPQRLLKEDTVK